MDKFWFICSTYVDFLSPILSTKYFSFFFLSSSLSWERNLHTEKKSAAAISLRRCTEEQKKYQKRKIINNKKKLKKQRRRRKNVNRFPKHKAHRARENVFWFLRIHLLLRVLLIKMRAITTRQHQRQMPTQSILSFLVC